MRVRQGQIAFAIVLAITVLAMVGMQPAHVARADDGNPAEVASFRGSYDGFSTPRVLGPFRLRAGLVVVRARHNGTKNLVISLRLPDPGAAPEDFSFNSYLMVDAIGRYDGSAADVARADGDYYLLIAAGGAYDISVQQPSPSTVALADQTTFAGRGQQVTAGIPLAAGRYTFTARTDNSAFFVALYTIDDLGGGPATTDYAARIIDTTRGTGTSVTLDLPAGLYLLAVDAEGTGSGNWSIAIE